MKKQILVLMMAMMLVPAVAMAMQHGEHGKSMDMDHGKKMEHSSGMSMGGAMIMLQDVEVDGVMASAHMLDVKAKMAEHGMPQTHHFMVGFMNGEGDSLAKGTVAVKISAPDGSVSKPIMLMGMSNAFGADVTLDQNGMYKFIVGTKLEDGKKRTFEMHYDNK